MATAELTPVTSVRDDLLEPLGGVVELGSATVVVRGAGEHRMYEPRARG